MIYSAGSRFTPDDLNYIENRTSELFTLISSLLGIENIYPSDDLYPGDDVFPTDYPTPVFKTDWDKDDIPFMEEIDRIKQNIIDVGCVIGCDEDEFDLKVGVRFFNYIEVNKLIYALEYIDSIVGKISFRYSGESYSGDTIWL